MTALVPAPPLDDEGYIRLQSFHLRAALVAGGLDGCVICQQGTVWAVDLSRLEVGPVTDRHGAPTDRMPLHDHCIPAVVEHWVTMTWGPGGDEADPDEPAPDPFAEVGDSAARSRTRVAEVDPASRERRRRLLGGLYGGDRQPD